LAINLRAFQLNQPVDFVPLAVFDDREAAQSFIRSVQAMRNQREQSGGGQWN
jgi:hypothetical protein